MLASMFTQAFLVEYTPYLYLPPIQMAQIRSQYIFATLRAKM